MPVGTYGVIKLFEHGDKVQARVQFRDYDGVRRQVSRWAATEAAAKRELTKALRDRTKAHGSTDLKGEDSVRTLAGRWLAEVEQSDRAEGSKRLYRIAVTNYVLPGMSGLRLFEVTVGGVDSVLQAVRAGKGPGAAKTTRSVLSGMFAYAVRHGAVSGNPVRETTPITRKASKPVRALTAEEEAQLVDGLRSSQRAVDLDLPDLVEFMLGTGVRIGEACAAVEAAFTIDADARAGTFEVKGTVIRVKGEGLLLQPTPKTAAGRRTLALPGYCVDMLGRRDGEVRLRQSKHRVIFPSANGYLRDPSNTSGDLRAVLDGLDFDWVTSHTFRKTVATKLDGAGLTARQIADHLGHEKPSMTTDVYMGRKVVSAEAATALDRLP